MKLINKLSSNSLFPLHTPSLLHECLESASADNQKNEQIANRKCWEKGESSCTDLYYVDICLWLSCRIQLYFIIFSFKIVSIMDIVYIVCDMYVSVYDFCHLTRVRNVSCMNHLPQLVSDTHFTLCKPCPGLGQRSWLRFYSWLEIPFHLPYQMYATQPTLRTHLKSHLPL